ncbi:MAG: PVC-type heme-binding CxxCH protein, partial [Planctomycetaceae bacterium]|nr:PVC-type heme-binding CxxCH protein [Planctomycetaceae bacterium]
MSVRLLCLLVFCVSPLFAADVIPHAQDKPPNEPRDPQTAAKMMTVPEGFVVDVVASEPDIVNPVAMAIDERGRFWITESLEYPRKSPGPGQDRVKILEDTDGDGKCDKFTVFLDGLNIPSGVQVGHGGVWIANSPDILFVPDANRDGVPDGPAQVVVTGFGRTDTHELPNSLTWGPDGWLYGLNGVFNYSHVKYPEGNPNYNADHPGWPLTCAMFRIHPRTREFQVFCEGTSNPWGIAFNDEGDAFVSACVIDHLWHLVETGYYHRQGGPYPPHTWKIESIVKHKHQKAAYCGITWFDSDAYPEQYRRKLYMGNIHGGCINVDRIERNGSTYAGFGEPDFLTANDAWFMPVVQKTGPDGCLYVLDWYDRYHCYQDANRDPKGIDRLKGRLYRVRYQGEPGAVRPRSASLDLATETDDQLIEELGHPNVWMRETAQRVLQERATAGVRSGLSACLKDQASSRSQKIHATFALLGAQPDDFTREDLEEQFGENFGSGDQVIRRWILRAHSMSPSLRQSMKEFFESDDLQPEFKGQTYKDAATLKLEYIILLGKSPTQSPKVINQLLWHLATAGDDPLIPRIVWQNLQPRLETHANHFVHYLLDKGYLQSKNITALMPRVVDRILDCKQFDAAPLANLVGLLCLDAPQVASDVLSVLAAKVQTGELKGQKLDQLKAKMAYFLTPMLGDANHPLRLEASLLAVSWRDKAGFAAARDVLESAKFTDDQRLAAASALIAAEQDEVLGGIAKIFEQSPPASAEFRGKLLATLARLDDSEVDDLVLKFYPKLEPELQSRAIELLTQRPAWAKELLTAIGDKQIAASVLNVNQARKLAESKDEAVRALLAKHWGQVRDGRSPDRDKFIAEMRALIRKSPGDAEKGQAAFKKVCAQCHKMYGEGAEVGPDITLNGRNDYTQLLSNVFDPSLVIGAGYRSFTVATQDGRVINGLLVEDSPQRVVLKVQGGKQEVIARDDVDEYKVSELSLMPEQLERQLTPPEIVDLFAYITLDKPHTDPSARRLPGVYDVPPRESTNPADFAAIVQEIAPGLTQVTSGEGGVALLKEHKGRPGVVRTHPVSRDKPAELSGKFAIPADRKTKLVVDVS